MACGRAPAQPATQPCTLRAASWCGEGHCNTCVAVGETATWTAWCHRGQAVPEPRALLHRTQYRATACDIDEQASAATMQHTAGASHTIWRGNTKRAAGNPRLHQRHAHGATCAGTDPIPPYTRTHTDTAWCAATPSPPHVRARTCAHMRTRARTHARALAPAPAHTCVCAHGHRASHPLYLSRAHTIVCTCMRV